MQLCRVAVHQRGMLQTEPSTRNGKCVGLIYWWHVWVFLDAGPAQVAPHSGLLVIGSVWRVCSHAVSPVKLVNALQPCGHCQVHWLLLIRTKEVVAAVEMHMRGREMRGVAHAAALWNRSAKATVCIKCLLTLPGGLQVQQPVLSCTVHDEGGHPQFRSSCSLC